MITHLNIGGSVWEITYVPALSAGGEALQGLTDVNTRTISINSLYDKDRQTQTLMHEVLHAILYVTGHSESLSDSKEEALVLAIEHLLWPLLPELLAEASECSRP